MGIGMLLKRANTDQLLLLLCVTVYACCDWLSKV